MNVAELEGALSLLDGQPDLPRFVCLTVPEGALTHNDWRSVIAASVPMCRCGVRRLLVPPTGRSRFVSHDPPLIVELAASVAGDPKILRIVPYGGDVQSPPVELEVKGLALEVRRDSLGLLPHTRRGFTLSTAQFTFSGLAQKVSELGEVEFPRAVLRGHLSIQVPSCSIVQVDPATGMIRVEVDASASVLTSEPSASPRHECALPLK